MKATQNYKCQNCNTVSMGTPHHNHETGAILPGNFEEPSYCRICGGMSDATGGSIFRATDEPVTRSIPKPSAPVQGIKTKAAPIPKSPEAVQELIIIAKQKLAQGLMPKAVYDGYVASLKGEDIEYLPKPDKANLPIQQSTPEPEDDNAQLINMLGVDYMAQPETQPFPKKEPKLSIPADGIKTIKGLEKGKAYFIEISRTKTPEQFKRISTHLINLGNKMGISFIPVWEKSVVSIKGVKK